MKTSSPSGFSPDGLLECFEFPLPFSKSYATIFPSNKARNTTAEEEIIWKTPLQSAMLSLDYHLVSTLEHPLPNGKKLVQMDFTSQ
jgi:hypothetical protein